MGRRGVRRTNRAIFGRLTSFAADRNVTIPEGERRVFLNEAEYEVLAESKRIEHFPIARRQAAALLHTSGREILVVSGFETDDFRPSAHIREIEMSPGIAVATIADLEVDPIVSPSTIMNVIAVSSESEVGYEGHDLDEVLRLFPGLRCVEIDRNARGVEHFRANLLILCASEGAAGNGWINTELSDELIKLGEQRIIGFPYEFLVMATLELDPKNLFLALYRCLEATYAFARASKLAKALDIQNKSWLEIAKALGDSLSWFPRHDQALADVLGLSPVSPDDLDELASSLGKDYGGEEVAARVAAGIRELRNSLVHYGPTTRHVELPDDWNQLCTPLARVVGSVFSHTYGDIETGAVSGKGSTAP